MGAWRDYELIVKAIYEALIREKQLDQWEVQHNVEVRGTKANHQIDVYCKFRLAEHEHQIVIQVKREKNRAKQGDLFQFDCILKDIPGQPRGIFITLKGYQSGALNYARQAGIVLLQLFPIEKYPVRNLPLLAVAHVKLLTKKLAFQWVVWQATLREIQIVVDPDWWRDQKTRSQQTEIRGVTIDLARFCDAEGLTRNSVRTLVQERIKELAGQGTTQLNIEFSEPTFMEGFKVESPADFPLMRIKLIRFTATIDIVETISESPFRSEQYVTYVMRDVLGESHRYVLISPEGPEPKAIISLVRGGTRQSY